MEKIKKYKFIIIIVAICVLLEIILMQSFAFFNYEEPGVSSALLTVGNISVDYNELHALGSLTKLDKRSAYDSSKYVGFSLTGRNAESTPLYYYITINEGDASSTTGAVRLRDDLLKYRLVSFPTENDYNNDTNGTDVFTTTDYSKDFGALNDTIIAKGTVAANTNSDTTTYYKLYVWINNDTNICSVKGAGCDYYSIEQYPKWDNVYATLKVDVNANFTNTALPTSLYDAVKTGATNDVTGGYNGAAIDFSNRNYLDATDTTTQSNGNGKFVLSTTVSDNYPIYYYRGDAKIGTANELKNNVVFAGYCWKIVRTTETGGIKMIYNGEYTTANKCNNSASNGSSTRGETSIKEGSTTGFAFNPSYQSVAYMGYSYTKYITMQNGNERTDYEWVENAKPDAGTPNDTTDDANVIFGGDVSYNNGVYTLVNTDTGIATTRHYTCNSTNSSATCEKVRYYYYYDTTNSKYYYIELEGGDDVEDALDSMLNHATDTYSNVQLKINNWYNTNIKPNYDNYIEDTVWCMERNRTLNNDGWMANGGSLTTNLWTTTFKRAYSNHNTIKLKCDGTLAYGTKDYVDYYPSRNETVDQLYYGYGSGNIGSKAALLTYDEVKLAGMKYYANTTYKHNYLYTGYWYWLLSPAFFGGVWGFSGAGIVLEPGELNYTNVDAGGGVRPTISLNHGTQISGGTGTVANPYIVT